MKRFLTGLALACAAALVTAAPAQAAPVDPVKALKKQFVAGHGVRFTEKSVTKVSGKTSSTEKTTGRLAFGKKGVEAVDLSTKATGDALINPSRMISLGGYTYVQGGVYAQDLPEGKKWVRYEGPSGTSNTQPLDIFQPKVLKALVAKATSFKGGVYTGAITYKELGKVYGTPVKGEFGKIKIDYLLAVNSKGLITRIKSEWTLDFGVLGKTTGLADTRFSSWGSTVKIKAPAEDLWVDVKDLGENSEVPEENPLINLNAPQRKIDAFRR